MASLSNEAPLYHVAQELTSSKITRREKLNIEEVSISSEDGSVLVGERSNNANV